MESSVYAAAGAFYLIDSLAKCKTIRVTFWKNILSLFRGTGTNAFEGGIPLAKLESG